VLVPPPLPAYTLAPDVGELTPAQRRALECCLRSLSGRVPGVMVTGAGRTTTHEVLELDTALGRVIVLERLPSRPS